MLILASVFYYFDINPFPHELWFLRFCSISLLKTLWGKEILLLKSNFSFYLSVFYPFGYISVISITNENRRLQTLSVWKCLKFVVWKGLRNKLDLVHLKSNVKYKSDIKQPKCGCSAQSRNRDNSRIVPDKVGILTLSGEVGIPTWHGSIPESSLRKVGIGTK